MNNNDQNIKKAAAVVTAGSKKVSDEDTKPGAVHVLSVPDQGEAVASIITSNDEDTSTSVAQLRQMVATSTKTKNEKENLIVNSNNLSQMHHSGEDGDSDLEHGEYTTSHLNINNNSNSDGLAVACPININDDTIENMADMYIPTAVEYDNDIKPKSSVNNHRFHLILVMIIATIVISTIGIVVGINLTSKQQQDMNQQRKGLSYRETIGIYENIARLISTDELNDSKSPYKKAMDWITFDDPLLLTPDHPRFMQRYLLSYFYFATSIAGNWTDDCAPDSSKRDECKYTPSCAKKGEAKIPSFRWFSKQDECEWAGIKCDQLQQIMIVDLSTDGMTGFFPQGITLLPYLHELYLQCGTLTGPIADHLNGEDITLLSELSLKNNTFTGTIPEQLIQSHSLNKLILQSNQLNGTIPTNLFSLFDLNYLDLGSNELIGTLPNELDQLRNIKYVSLENNNFIGTIPSSYDKMTYLLALYLSDNFITGTIPNEFGTLKKVKDFFAARNRLNGSIPENFWNANLLSNIYLDNNALTGTISNKIQQLKDLTDFSISNNYFTGTLPARIGTAGDGSAYELGLLFLRAYGNQLNGTVPQHLCNLVQGGTLEALELDCAPAIISSTEVAEITCPIDCCTLCCTPDGINCK